MAASYDPTDDYDDNYRGHVEPHRGTLILVLGILAFVICGFIGIAAWLMGKNDLKLVAEGRMDREGEGLTRAGYILGIIATIMTLLGMLLFCAYIGIMFLVFGLR